MNKNTETSQQKLNRMMAEAQRRFAAKTPVGVTKTDRHGKARWNGAVWVYGQ